LSLDKKLVNVGSYRHCQVNNFTKMALQLQTYGLLDVYNVFWETTYVLTYSRQTE